MPVVKKHRKDIALPLFRKIVQEFYSGDPHLFWSLGKMQWVCMHEVKADEPYYARNNWKFHFPVSDDVDGRDIFKECCCEIAAIFPELKNADEVEAVYRDEIAALINSVYEEDYTPFFNPYLQNL